MNDLRAAAERVRNMPGIAFRVPQGIEDISTLASAYLAEHPADEDEPYSGDAWLEGFGIAIGVTKDKQGRWWAEAHQDDQRIVLSEIKTRGDFRKLASVLGIPLKESEARDA